MDGAFGSHLSLGVQESPCRVADVEAAGLLPFLGQPFIEGPSRTVVGKSVPRSFAALFRAALH